MENILPFLLFSIVLALFGLVLALPMRLSFMRKLWHTHPVCPSTLAFILALLAFAIPFIGSAHLSANITYLFATIGPHGMSPDPASPIVIHRDAIVTELWLRAVTPPADAACFTHNATACAFADENAHPSWGGYLLMVGLCLLAVAVNQWAIWRWRRWGGKTAVSPLTPSHAGSSHTSHC